MRHACTQCGRTFRRAKHLVNGVCRLCRVANSQHKRDELLPKNNGIGPRVLVWTVDFENRSAGPFLFKEAKRQGLNVAITGSRANPEEMLPVLHSYKPDWVFCFNIRQQFRHYYDEIKKTGARLLFWYPDQCERTRDRMWRSMAGIPDVAVFSILHAAQTYRDIPKLSVWMPQYFDARFCSNDSPFLSLPTRLDARKPIYDLCFIGSCDHRRAEWLDVLKREFKCNFTVHPLGRGLNEIRGYRMAEAYAQSKIAFNIQRELFLNPGPFITSNRAYNAMGSGAFFINHYVNQLDLLWDEGTHCVTYNDTLDELIEKIRYWLRPENEVERERIAERGQTNILAFHTLEQRVREYWSVMDLFDNHGPAALTVANAVDGIPAFGDWMGVPRCQR